MGEWPAMRLLRDWLFPGPVRVRRVTHQGREGYEVWCEECMEPVASSISLGWYSTAVTAPSCGSKLANNFPAVKSHNLRRERGGRH